MSSGKYSALSGALVRMHSMDSITDNLGNAGTAGFKKGQGVFQAVLDETRSRAGGKGINFSRLKVGYTDFSQGTLVKTGVSLHVALHGEGLFKVRDEGGNLFYTRQGSMDLHPDGTLRTAMGMHVLDDNGEPIVLPDADIVIDEAGGIDTGDGNPRRIGVFVLDDQTVLLRRSGGLFAVDGEPRERPAETTRVLQGHTEESNVNMMREVAVMIETQRAFEACLGAIKNYSKIGEKANEIGVLG